MSENRIIRIFGYRIFLIALFILLSIGKLFCQFEKDYLTIGFDINNKISIGLQIPRFVVNNRLSDYTIPYKYGIRKDSTSCATAFFVIDTISKNDFRILCSMESLDSARTNYGQLIRFYRWFNYNKYEFYVNGLCNIVHSKIVMISFLSSDLKDFNYYFDSYKTMIKTLILYEAIEILEVVED